MGAPCLHTQIRFPVSPAPTDFHTGTTKNYHPTTTAEQQELAPPSPHFHLVASTRQMVSTCFTPESTLLFFETFINTTRNDGSKNSKMVAIATDTSATSMQPYPSQPYLSRGIHLLIKAVSIGLSHMESPTGFSQDPEMPPQRLFFCFKENSLFWKFLCHFSHTQKVHAVSV